MNSKVRHHEPIVTILKLVGVEVQVRGGQIALIARIINYRFWPVSACQIDEFFDV